MKRKKEYDLVRFGKHPERFEGFSFLADPGYDIIEWFETDGAYILEAKLMQFKKDDVIVRLPERKVIDIAVLSKDKGEVKFSRHTVLPPDVVVEKIKAKLVKGILTVIMPKWKEVIIDRRRTPAVQVEFPKEIFVSVTVEPEIDNDVRKGTVKWFNDQKGFGFITPEDGTEDLFVHQTAIKTDDFRSLCNGESVEYLVDYDRNGRAKATNVTGPNGGNVQGNARRFGGYVRRDRGGGYSGGGNCGYRDGGGYGRGGGSGGGCYKCGENGHMARECVQGGRRR